MVLRRIIIVRGGAQDIGVSAFQEIAPHDALARVSEFWRGRFGEGKLAACAGKIALEKKRFAKTNGQSYVFRIQFYPAALQLDRPIVISARKEKRRCGLEYLIVGWPAAEFLFETAQSAFGSRAAEIVDVGHGLVIVRISEKEGSKFGGWSGDDGDFVVVTQADVFLEAGRRIVFDPLRIEEGHTQEVLLHPNAPDHVRWRETERFARIELNLTFHIVVHGGVEKQFVLDRDESRVVSSDWFALIAFRFDRAKLDGVGAIRPEWLDWWSNLPLEPQFFVGASLIGVRGNPFTLDARVEDGLVEIRVGVKRPDTDGRAAARGEGCEHQSEDYQREFHGAPQGEHGFGLDAGARLALMGPPLDSAFQSSGCSSVSQVQRSQPLKL